MSSYEITPQDPATCDGCPSQQAIECWQVGLLRDAELPTARILATVKGCLGPFEQKSQNDDQSQQIKRICGAIALSSINEDYIVGPDTLSS